MIKNQWSKDAIIRAYERGLSLEEVREHFHMYNYSIIEILAVIQEKYPRMTL